MNVRGALAQLAALLWLASPRPALNFYGLMQKKSRGRESSHDRTISEAQRKSFTQLTSKVSGFLPFRFRSKRARAFPYRQTAEQEQSIQA